jgi:hypothetical protein
MTGTPEAASAYDRCVDGLLRWDGELPDRAEQLLGEHADAPMALAFIAYLSLIGSEISGSEAAKECWEGMSASPMNTREQAHHSAIGAWVAGDWQGAADRLDQLLVEWPADVLAIAIGHFLDFFLGDQTNLRDRVGRSLLALDPQRPSTALIRGMHAFGLEESGDLARAEEVGMAAIEVNPRDVWAIHAVAHVHEMRGRAEDGIRFLVERRDDWAADNLFKVHVWWHLALFNLEAGNVPEALGMYDAEVHNEQSQGVALEMLDASALLWRLQLDGHDTGARFDVLADAWQPVLDARPWYAFNDFHATMALVGAGRVGEAEKVVERLSAYVHANGGGTNVAMTHEVGLPASRALVRFAQGRYDDVVTELLPIRRTVQRFGGSHAQRDVVQRTLLEAAVRGGNLDLARALTSERLTASDSSVYGWHQRARVLDASGRGDEAGTARTTAERRRAIVQAAALEAGLEHGDD